jgi:anthranilate synthase component 1/para-aminobenzoate synthetase component 1
MFLLDKSDFENLAENERIAPLVWVQDLETKDPLSVLRNFSARIAAPYCLLESAGGGPFSARYSLLACEPLVAFRSKDGQNTVSERGKSPYTVLSDPFSLLREITLGYRPRETVSLELPFWGGAVGFLSYDAGRHLERLPSLATDDLRIPEMAFFIPGLLLVFDHRESLLYLVVNQIVRGNIATCYSAAKEKIEEVAGLLNTAPVQVAGGLFPAVEVASNLRQEQFENMVGKTLQYICAGDVYQVNLSQRLRVPFEGDPLSLYQRLREINPSPFAAYLNFGDFQLISSSPERLIELRSLVASTRPIAGTRPRGGDDEEEKNLAECLILDEKERAEHIMLVDLERNDLGRVCRYGSVRVSELMVLEKYSHVIHIVSNVKGELQEGKDQFDLIRAMFPGGTITGCPKVRCMEIIEELEPVRRGPYTGSIGYFGFNGEMDMNIIIRTILLRGGAAYVQVGAGIVADSKPEREYFETLHKAEAMLKALNATSYPLYSETKKVFL